MTIVDILLYSLVGLCVVFFALCLLIVMIKILTWEKKTAPASPTEAAVAASAAVPDVPKPLAPGTAGELKLYDTDPRDAAMIMAIVADELGKPLNELRFISIKEVK